MRDPIEIRFVVPSLRELEAEFGCQNRGGSAVPMIEETTMSDDTNKLAAEGYEKLAEALCLARNATTAALETLYREIAIEGGRPSPAARLAFARAVYATQAILDSVGMLPAGEILKLAADLVRSGPFAKRVDGPGITPLGQVPDRGYGGKPREVKPE